MEANTLDFENLRAVLEDYGREVAEQYRTNMRNSGRPASGELENSIKTRVEVNGSTWEVLMDLKGYWKYIEYGTKGRYTGNPNRKFPPLNEILKWVQIKPGLPRPAELTEEQFARKIAGKIMYYGTKGSPDLQNATREVTNNWRARIGDALAKDATFFIRKYLVSEVNK